MNFSFRFLEKLLFKKIESWVLCLVLVFGFVVVVLFGYAVRHTYTGGEKLGSLGPVVRQIASIPHNIRTLILSIENPSLINPMFTTDQERFSGLSGWTPPLPSNTQTEIKSKSDLGLLLINRYDGDRENWVVELIDLNQQHVIHRWINSSAKLFYDQPSVFDPVESNQRSFSYSLLHQDGSLTSMDRNSVIRTIDACSNLVWNSELIERPSFHHSIEKDAEGYLWVPLRIYPQTLPGVSEDFNDDAIAKLASGGKVLFKRSVGQILIDNGYRYLIYGMGWDLEEDPIHLNDIQPVDNDGPFWKKGDLFLSLRNQSMIMLYRPSTNKIIWNQQGPWNLQHDVDILNDHQISIFDNNVNVTDKGSKVMGHNQVMIYDFETNETTSPYKAALAMNDVRTPTRGGSEIYQNDDVFIEETEYGRLLRVTPDGEVVWQYVNRARDGGLYHVAWSRIIHAENRGEFTNFLKDLDCEKQQ